VTTTVAMALSGELAKNGAVSLLEFVEGFVPAVVLGIAFGLALSLSRRLRYLFDPLLGALYTAPRVALIPIFVIWFGVGPQSKVFIVFISTIFPVLINTLTGIEGVDPTWIRAVRAFGANQLQVARKAILPGALPTIMAGVRLGLGRAIVGLIAGEMYVSLAGIGRLVQVYSSAGRAAQIIVLVTLISVFGFACIALLRWFEERVAPWRLELEH